MMDSSQQIKMGALMSYFALGINVLSGLIYTPWMISSIGREDYGLFTLAMSVINLFVFDFGLSSAVTRFVSKFLAEGRQDRANDCLGLVYKLYFYIDIVLFIVLTSVFFFIPQIYHELTPDEIDKFKVVYVVAAIFTVTSFPFIPLNGILTAYEKFVPLKVCDVINKLLIVGTMTICLLMGGGLYALVIVNAVSGTITILLKIICIKRYTSAGIHWGYKDSKLFKEIISFSGWTTVVSVCQRLMFTLAPSILGIISGSTAIAIFGIAASIESYVYYFAYALNGMFLPRVSQILSKQGDVMPLMNKVGRIQLMIVGSIVFGFICLGEHFINIWVGESFAQSYWCSILLIIPTLIYLPQEIGIQTIIAKNEVKYQALVWTAMAVVNIILSFLLGRIWGAVGISLSICIAYFVRTFGMDVILKNRLKLNLSPFFVNTFAKVGWVFVPVCILSALINNILPSDGILLFIIKTVVYLAIVFVALIIVSNQEEKNLVTSIIGAVLRKKNNKDFK